MPGLRLALAAFLSAASLAAEAAYFPDPSGLWYDSRDPGWGLSVAQQGDTMFVVLYVYDASRNPLWFVASDVTAASDSTAASPRYSGTLYDTTGPWFGMASGVRLISIDFAGTIVLQPVSGSLDDMDVTYTIHGLHVSRRVQRETWGSGLAALTGEAMTGVAYAGGPVITAKSPDTCPDFNFPPENDQGTARSVPFHFFASTPDPASSQVGLGWGTGSDTGCEFGGTYSQHGQLGEISGTFSCAPIGFPPQPDDPTVDITNIVAGPDGFSGALTLQKAGCTYTGHIGGVRTR